MEEHKISSVRDFVRVAIDITSRWLPGDFSPPLWYRGVKDEDLDLLPGAYFRHPCDEETLTLHFRQLTPGLLSHQPIDDWEWYYAMQHYGLPTRLLDWSESALAALYFAVEEEATTSPVVWVLHPVELNRLAGWNFLIVPKQGNELDYWLPNRCGRGFRTHTFKRSKRFHSNRKPLAIYPKRHNPRIIAQRGVFTVHGKDEMPLNHLKIVDRAGNARLAKIVMRPQRRAIILKQLYMLGFNKTSIYPEPQSVSIDLKRGMNPK